MQTLSENSFHEPIYYAKQKRGKRTNGLCTSVNMTILSEYFQPVPQKNILYCMQFAYKNSFVTSYILTSNMFTAGSCCSFTGPHRSFTCAIDSRYHTMTCAIFLERSCMEVTSQMTGTGGCAGHTWRSSSSQR